MPELKKSPKKARVAIKNLGSGAAKKIGSAEAKSIRGGTIYSCPSQKCKSLVVKIATTASAQKVHKVVIYTVA